MGNGFCVFVCRIVHCNVFQWMTTVIYEIMLIVSHTQNCLRPLKKFLFLFYSIDQR